MMGVPHEAESWQPPVASRKKEKRGGVRRGERHPAGKNPECDG